MKTLERELEWVRMAPKARHAKSKARLNAYDKLLNEDVKEKEETLQIFIPNGPRLGNVVIEAQHTCMSMRGVQKSNAITTTSAFSGIFLSSSRTRNEFLNLIDRK